MLRSSEIKGSALRVLAPPPVFASEKPGRPRPSGGAPQKVASDFRRPLLSEDPPTWPLAMEGEAAVILQHFTDYENLKPKPLPLISQFPSPVGRDPAFRLFQRVPLRSLLRYITPGISMSPLPAFHLDRVGLSRRANN